jgi:hypothetical protein
MDKFQPCIELALKVWKEAKAFRNRLPERAPLVMNH